MISGIGIKVGYRLSVIGYRRTPNTENRKPRYGFTLVEAMVAVTILAFGTIGVLRAFAMAVTAVEAGQYSVDAMCLLRERMAGIEKDALEGTALTAGVYNGEFDGKDSGFKWQTVVQPLNFSNEEMDGLLDKVKVTVYNDNVKPPRRFSMETYVDAGPKSKK
ncbi:MAG: prepilin-type N-terminal cleavage/methylation domain-containing protein [Candidatus Omnitrophota bacterium]